MKDETIWCRCAECGATWQIDFEIVPEFCEEYPWTLGIGGDDVESVDWGVTTDREGNEV